MSKDLNSLFDFIDGTKAAQKSGNKNDPLSDYIAYEKARDMERELEKIIFETRGSRGVAKFKDMRRQAAESERQSKYAAIARRNKILNILSILAGITITAGGAVGMIYFAMKYAP